jgi:hypothetical protein
MKKKVGMRISKCLKLAAKNRRADQMERANLSAPIVYTLDISNNQRAPGALVSPLLLLSPGGPPLLLPGP